jgi:hypothetical protein
MIAAPVIPPKDGDGRLPLTSKVKWHWLLSAGIFSD